jgi:myo-inositol-1(or 4)-monophosphatase
VFPLSLPRHPVQDAPAAPEPAGRIDGADDGVQSNVTMTARDDLDDRRKTAREAAVAAGEVLMAHYGRRAALVIDQKGVNDFVSQADRDAEDAILTRLAARFPEDALLGEETGASGGGGSGLTWCVDPLDGTSNFLKGAPNWCVSIGLLAGVEPVLGVILDPVRGEIFEGGPGLAARCNGADVRCNAEADPGRCLIGIGRTKRIALDTFAADTQALLATGLAFRQVGAGALMLAYLSAGRIDAYFERHMWPWDAVAGLALIRGAGGAVAPYLAPGAIAEGGPALAANAGLLPVLRRTLDV